MKAADKKIAALKAEAKRLRARVEQLEEAGKVVVDSWEGGDMAYAVNFLRLALAVKP